MTLKRSIGNDNEVLQVYMDPSIQEYLSDRQSKNDLLNNLGERSCQQQNLAADAQSKYNSFVTRYFRDLNDERQLAKKVATGLLAKVN